MKKFLIIFVLFINLLSFGSDVIWISPYELNKYKDNLKPYDIVVLNPGKKFVQQWGHLFLISKEKKIIELKGFDYSFAETPIFTFLDIDRKFSIMRFPNLTKEMEDIIEDLLPKYYNKEYSVFIDDDPDSLYSYCSKFIYNIYNEASKKLGKEIKLVNPLWPILPLEFLESEYLINVDITQIPPKFIHGA